MGLLHWDIPASNADSISSYQVTYKKVNPEHGEEKTFTTKFLTYVLENLDADSSYEVINQVNDFLQF